MMTGSNDELPYAAGAARKSCVRYETTLCCNYSARALDECAFATLAVVGQHFHGPLSFPVALIFTLATVLCSAFMRVHLISTLANKHGSEGGTQFLDTRREGVDIFRAALSIFRCI